MSSKQSSVEWLYEELLAQFYLQIDSLMSEEIKGKIEQAKAMHKEEVKKAIMFGDCRGEISTYATSEQYYNETFNAKEK